MKQGLLLINLGTPDAPNRRSVRRFLSTFLSDPLVLDLPFIVRHLLLYGLILPLRIKKVTQAYQKIWTKEGSPLRFLSTSLEKKLQSSLHTQYQVALGIRYGEPSIAQALQQLKHCETLTILPLYPQYAHSTTQSAIEHVLQLIKQNSNWPSLNIIRDFYRHPGFIVPLSTQIQAFLLEHEHLLLSYHGLPVRHLKKTGCPSVCEHACPQPIHINSECYRAQCFETSRALAKQLGLKATQYSTTFQSRFGKTPWIGPALIDTLHNLRHRGIRTLAVAAPSFVTDCLETREELGLRTAELWHAIGGEKFTLIPCVNDESSWVEGIMEIIRTDDKLPISSL